jgi:hypothetical protein
MNHIAARTSAHGRKSSNAIAAARAQRRGHELSREDDCRFVNQIWNEQSRAAVGESAGGDSPAEDRTAARAIAAGGNDATADAAHGFATGFGNWGAA